MKFSDLPVNAKFMWGGNRYTKFDENRAVTPKGNKIGFSDSDKITEGWKRLCSFRDLKAYEWFMIEGGVYCKLDEYKAWTGGTIRSIACDVECEQVTVGARKGDLYYVSEFSYTTDPLSATPIGNPASIPEGCMPMVLEWHIPYAVPYGVSRRNVIDALEKLGCVPVS